MLASQLSIRCAIFYFLHFPFISNDICLSSIRYLLYSPTSVFIYICMYLHTYFETFIFALHFSVYICFWYQHCKVEWLRSVSVGGFYIQYCLGTCKQMLNPVTIDLISLWVFVLNTRTQCVKIISRISQHNILIKINCNILFCQIEEFSQYNYI